MVSKRTATLAGVLALSALFALVTLSAVSSGPRRYALEGEEPMQGEDAMGPVFTDEVNEEEPPFQEPEGAVAEPEDVTTPVDPHMEYSMLHPVYTRCAKKADMDSFVQLITKSCGDIHELDTCSAPCAHAMREYSTKVGCCWETVMHAYKTLDPGAELAWRHWQGTLSGKCGITFEDDTCGDSVGEHGYSSLNKKVKELESRAQENEEYINDLYYQRYFGSSGGYDNGGYGGDDYGYYGDDGADGAWKNNGEPDALEAPKEGDAAPGEILTPKHKLGDEVYDLPNWGGHDEGDVHMPADQIKPYQFAHPSLRQVRRKTTLAGAYDDSVNYANSLRLADAYSKIVRAEPNKKDSEFFSWPGESWGKKASKTSSLSQSPERGSFPLARGPLQGAVGENAVGYGMQSQAGLDPVNGRPMIEEDPEEEGRFRLTDEAAVRQAWHERRVERGEGDPGTPASWLDHSRNPQASAGVDSGDFKLNRMGVRV